MNSYNHYAYGAIADWLYQVVAGIKTDDKEVGFKKIIFAPEPGGSITSALATIESNYGLIKSSWKIRENEMFFESENTCKYHCYCKITYY